MTSRIVSVVHRDGCRFRLDGIGKELKEFVVSGVGLGWTLGMNVCWHLAE